MENTLPFSFLRNTLQETQNFCISFSQAVLGRIGGNGAAAVPPVTLAASPQQDAADKDLYIAKRQQEVAMQLDAWHRKPSWTDHPPDIKVAAPKGTLCYIESTFQLGMPPDVLFDIVTDQDNKRVFKSIKEVTYRKVLEEEGHRQLVEVEQTAIWRFLCFSGTMSIRLFVDQDMHTRSMKFHLAKEGFMKKFEGTWDVKPVYIDSPHCERLSSPEDDASCRASRMASAVHFRQTLQPIYVPPPPVSWYIRGISRKQTESLIEDLQAEARRLREGGATTGDG